MCVGPAIGVDTVRKGIMIRPVQSWKRETNDEFTSAAGCANQPKPYSHDADTKAKRGTSNAGVSDQAEIDKLIDATKWNRWGHRDAT